MTDSNLLIKWNDNLIIREEARLGSNIFGQYNKVLISGVLEDEFKFSHQVLNEKFYETRVISQRWSNAVDYIPIVISESLLKDIDNAPIKGRYVELAGEFRSHNKGEEKKKLLLYLFVKAIEVYEEGFDFELDANVNMLYLEGYVCKPTIFRETPKGKEICDVLIAVNGRYKRSSYIPCIAWGKNAERVRDLEVGEKIKLYGRIQSREYIKMNYSALEESEMKIAYEISILMMYKVNKELE